MSHESSDLKQSMDEAVRRRLIVLSLMRFNDLAQLPNLHSEDIVWKGTKFVLSVWHDILSSQEHRVVVQAYKPGILGTGRMQADGFAISSQNEKRPLTLEEWAPFS